MNSIFEWSNRTSEKAPLGSLLYAQLSKEAGIPDGIVQVLGGLGNTGKLLAEHMRIRKISCKSSIMPSILLQ